AAGTPAGANSTRGTTPTPVAGPAPDGPAPVIPPRPADAPPIATGGGSAGSNGASGDLPEPSLGGVVRPPGQLISDLGSALVSDLGSALISNNGGSLLGNNGAGVISNNGGSLTSIVRLPYHVQDASGPLGVLKKTFIYLASRDEKYFVDSQTGQAFTATTDNNGAYRFPISTANGFPLDKDVVVNAIANGNLRLTGYAVPTSGVTSLDLTLGSTLGTELLRGDAYRTGRALTSYDFALFQQAIAQTDQAIATGDIAAIKTILDQAGQPLKVGTFDLRIDNVQNLRNQYAIAISAVPVGNVAIKALSDTWKQLLGYRPAAVTTLFGNGQYPASVTSNSDTPAVSGDQRAGSPTLAGKDIAAGFSYGVATSRRGDVFSAHYTFAPNSGHIRWIKPDGTITSLWLPTMAMGYPGAIAIEHEPTDDPLDPNYPGTLLVTSVFDQLVYRVPILDHPVWLTPGVTPKYPMELVAGEGDLAFSGAQAALDAEHPRVVDGPAGYPAPDATSSLANRWRYKDEGVRRYTSTNVPVPNAARYAYLGAPEGLAVDELGNIYIADSGNHRIRMIPKATGSYFQYAQPTYDPLTGLVQSFGAPTALQAGCIYTIAGNPRWDTSATDYGGGSWFGEYAGDGGPCQQAKLGYPQSLAFSGGYLYVSDNLNQRVRRISRATGVIETVVGNPTGAPDPVTQAYANGFAGDGGPAVSAQLAKPQSITFDAAGRLFLVDGDSGRLRMVTADGRLVTLAGRLHDGRPLSADHSSDGEALRFADLYESYGIGLDPQGNVIFSDVRHLRVRKLWRQWD
ncbi:MAG: serine/threonine protein kinase, partial [Cyanobacteria bacterium RYN_339]|nr:serine/threonine protein kinase [Cyanobacteria bacterium RYN_339]